jgi:cytochrome-b5 reductase
VDKAPANWDYSEGFINADMIARHLPFHGDDVQILMCGPPPMLKFACIPNLEKVGFSEKNFFTF